MKIIVSQKTSLKWGGIFDRGPGFIKVEICEAVLETEAFGGHVLPAFFFFIQSAQGDGHCRD